VAEQETAQEDRTEAATPRRLQRAREAGDVPISRELPAFAGLACVVLVLMVAGSGSAYDMTVRLESFLARAHQWDASDGGAAAFAALAGARLAAPFILAALVGGVTAVLLQSGGTLKASALQPDLGRLNPGAGLRRLVGSDNLVESGKSLAKLAIVGVVVWRVLAGMIGQLAQVPSWDFRVLPDRLLRACLQILLAVLAVQAGIAALDLLWVRLHHARRLRMSREDVRQEHKEMEGDPHVKGRLKQLRLQRGRKRMLAAVPKATVVLTNPTHYAVALAYDRARNAAPRVVAKGVDEMAARIRAVAQENNVPLVANPPLTRALFPVALDSEIPAEHYQAVAEIIAYVWRLRQRAAGGVR
jgi:flagellar biosynthesis protein FlhB